MTDSRESLLIYKVAHVTVHLGGGIGSVLMNWIDTDKINKHKIFCLNNNYYSSYDKELVKENLRNNKEELFKGMDESDIVVVHYWNHPYLFEYLLYPDLPKCRMCIWSHVSGLRAPYVFPKKLIDFCDRLIFSSPISYKADNIRNLKDNNKLGHIWTTGNIDKYLDVKPIPHEGFNIGFVGTLDYSKLHPNFINFCSKIDIPDVKFIMCGGGCDLQKIKQQVKERGLESKFVFTGVIDDVRPYLAIIDVFGYPLNPDHFGTCEQVLGEAIAAGIIPIVMKNPAEEYILFQSLVKFICHDEEEYIHNIKLLYRDRHKRESIVNLIKDHVTKLYDSGNMVRAWNKIFDSLSEKQNHKWEMDQDKDRSKGYNIYMESLGEYGKILEQGSVTKILDLFNSNLQWRSSSKGSPRQYLDAFPDDKNLKELVNLL